MPPDRTRPAVRDARKRDIPSLRETHRYLLAAATSLAVVAVAVGVVAGTVWLVAYVVAQLF